jgi:hypothetical protein
VSTLNALLVLLCTYQLLWTAAVSCHAFPRSEPIAPARTIYRRDSSFLPPEHASGVIDARRLALSPHYHAVRLLRPSTIRGVPSLQHRTRCGTPSLSSSPWLLSQLRGLLLFSTAPVRRLRI